jgi:hypothetical protein
VRKIAAGLLGIVVALLSAAGAAQAQNFIQINGTIQGFYCGRGRSS